jgi:hypothetical protein
LPEPTARINREPRPVACPDPAVRDRPRLEEFLVLGTNGNKIESRNYTGATVQGFTTADHIALVAEQRPRCEGDNNEEIPMTAGDAQSRPRKPSTQMPSQREQRKEMEEHRRETLNPLIGEQVIHTLGKPGDLLTLQVRRLWRDHYRVNVFAGADVTSARVAHSYFIVTDDDGNITASTPRITRRY